MKYEVEEWNRWDYPSYWEYVDSFDTPEEAIDYVKSQNNHIDFRVVQEIYRGSN